MSFAFPIPKLTSLLNNQGKPTRMQLLEIQRQLNFGVAVEEREAPPPSAVIPPGTDPEERSELRAQHAVQVKAYDDLKKADRALLR
jgi:hypothetical protein